MGSDADPDPASAGPGPRIGAWVRSRGMVGLVAAADGDTVTLFRPGDRQLARVAPDDVELLPAGAVTVTATVDLPVPHGIGEDLLRRWVASLTDETLRGRAYAALADAGLDEGAALPSVRLEVRTMATGGALCLCGAKTPADPGVAVACAACGRQAVSAPQPAVGDR